jgi:hypothetical protein
LISNLNCISSTGSTRWMRTAALPTFRKAWGKVPGLSDRSRLLRMVRLEVARRRCDKIQRNPPLVEVDADIKAGTRRTCNASHPFDSPFIVCCKTCPNQSERLVVYVEHNFPVKEFYGRKANTSQHGSTCMNLRAICNSSCPVQPKDWAEF